MTSCHHLPSRREALIGSGACSPGPRCRSSRARRAAIRACSSSCCGARSTGWAPSRRSAIPTGSACAATGRSCSTAGRRRCRSIASSRSIRRCRTCTGSTRRSKPTIVHATATPYRERSHFDGQDVLESGIARPGAVDTGWLNRALLALASDGRVDPRGGRALGVGSGDPAGGARAGARDVVGAATTAAGQR